MPIPTGSFELALPKPAMLIPHLPTAEEGTFNLPRKVVEAHACRPAVALPTLAIKVSPPQSPCAEPSPIEYFDFSLATVASPSEEDAFDATAMNEEQEFEAFLASSTTTTTQQRSAYRCGRCGQIKKGHICTAAPGVTYHGGLAGGGMGGGGADGGGVSGGGETTPAPRTRTARCGECEGCVRGDCGGCINCRDKPKFGGPGARRQGCELRRCVLLSVEGEKHSHGTLAPADPRVHKELLSIGIPEVIPEDDPKGTSLRPPSAPESARPRAEVVKLKLQGHGQARAKQQLLIAKPHHLLPALARRDELVAAAKRSPHIKPGGVPLSVWRSLIGPPKHAPQPPAVVNQAPTPGPAARGVLGGLACPEGCGLTFGSSQSLAGHVRGCRRQLEAVKRRRARLTAEARLGVR